MIVINGELRQVGNEATATIVALCRYIGLPLFHLMVKNMTYQVLSRKLRPKAFQEVIGQEHVIRSLSNAVKLKKIGHAYLFSGTRGVGKTTVARIFAKAIRCDSPLSNGNPCNICKPCLDFNVDNSMDIIEIDGASNNSVENIRDLIANVQYLPTTGKYRIYIIDEVHMLSNSAFNALLKTLEEPPEHVVFMFATTEPHKIPATIVSRSQRFDFKSVSINDSVKFIKDVAMREKIHFGDENIYHEIAMLGYGSVRDVLSVIDQILSYADGKELTEDILVHSVGMAKSSSIKLIAYGILRGNVNEVSGQYRHLLEDNISVQNILRSLLNLFFSMIEKIDDENYEHREILQDISFSELFWIYEILAKDSIWVLDSIDANKVFEILLQKITRRRDFFSTGFDWVDSKKKTEIVIEEEVPPGSFHEENYTLPLENTKPIEDKPNEMLSEVNEVTKNWDDFIHFLYTKSPASASNLEQGNIVKPLEVNANGVYIELGFKESEKVFFDYLNEISVFKKLQDNLADFFHKNPGDIQIKLFLVDEIKKKEYNFQSRAEINQEKLEEDRENKKQQLLNDENIKEAQRLFGVEVDKIVLKD